MKDGKRLPTVPERGALGKNTPNENCCEDEFCVELELRTLEDITGEETVELDKILDEAAELI